MKKRKSRVNQLTFLNFPSQFDVPSVIFFSRDGCHYCNKLKPIYNKISLFERYEDAYAFYIVDADSDDILYEKFQPDGVPTIYVIYEEDCVEIPYPDNPKESGYGEEDITKFLDELME